MQLHDRNCRRFYSTYARYQKSRTRK